MKPYRKVVAEKLEQRLREWEKVLEDTYGEERVRGPSETILLQRVHARIAEVKYLQQIL